MSMFGDYGAYKKYEPAYNEWKERRDTQEAKRLEYLKQNPDAINPEDIKRGKTLLRAIDIMDEYSQRNAENMEVATESVGQGALSFAMMGGALAGFGVSRIKSVNKFLMSVLTKMKPKTAQIVATTIPSLAGVLISTAAAFPVFALSAKAEIAASKKGRFEAMKNELSDPKAFAVLTEEQMAEVKNRADKIPVEEVKQKEKKGFIEGMKLMKGTIWESKAYKAQRKEFEDKINAQSEYFDKDFTQEEIEDAKKDQQLLTKLVEKIDIASQDYAENAELGVSALITSVFAFSTLMDIGLTKLMNAMKVKSASTISAALKVFTVAATLGASIASASITKEASKIGRFKVKDYLSKHPESLVYVPDEATGEISDVEIEGYHKPGFFHFMRHVWGDNRRYQKYKKNEANDEKRFYKALESIEITPEQEKDAKRLQKNTFMTFNKVDHNSQKYSESVEALGQSISYPITSIATLIGAVLGTPYLFKGAKGGIEQVKNFSKYFSIILLSTLPAMAANAYLTKKQKRASRVADMLSIQELNDYRHFADYSKEIKADVQKDKAVTT